MQYQDAVKARIQKLEGDMWGLTERLKRLRHNPTFFSQDTPVSGAFNTQATRKPLDVSFHSATMLQELLEQQIIAVRGELEALSFNHQQSEFRLAA